jgi:hypothetical protein
MKWNGEMQTATESSESYETTKPYLTNSTMYPKSNSSTGFPTWKFWFNTKQG